MNKLKYILSVLLVTAFIGGCDKDFESINTDPNNPIVVPSSKLIADIVRVSANTSYSTFVGGDMGSCWSQQWAKVQYNDEERYVPRQGIISSVWNNFYETTVSDAVSMESLAIDEGNKVTQGVALVLQAYGFLYLTDCFGDVPCTEAIRTSDNIFKPVYDEQSVVYDTCLARLDRANTLLASGEGSIEAAFDLIYAGDASKWQKFANSLKFRALMRISGARDVSADLQALVTRPMFTSSGDEAKLVYLSTQPNANPIYESVVYGTRLEYRTSDVLINTLVDLTDPRLEVYAEPNEDGDYRGKPAGVVDVPSDDWNYKNVSGIGELYLEPALPGYFMSYAQLLFLMAEAIEKGYISGDSKAFYLAGINTSLDENGITDKEAYLAHVAESYTAGAPEALDKIGTQEWLALYCQGIESWTEWRRTGFPVLQPALEAVYDEIPSRFNYPVEEQSVNVDNYKAAVETQGEDLLTTKIWWMK
jgi:hypothetical protein